MNRSFWASEREQMGNLRQKDSKDEELALFQEMCKREKERNNLLLLQNSNEFDAPLGSRIDGSPIFNITAATPAPVRKTGADEFLNSDGEKNDYEWLLTPPGTPLFPSLEMESQKSAPKFHSPVLKSRLANSQPELASRSHLLSRQPASSLRLNTSTGGLRRPSSSGGPGSRAATPTGRPTLSSTSRSSLTPASDKSTLTTASKLTSIMSSKVTSTTSSKPSRSATPTSRASLPSAKHTVPPRSATPTSRATLPSAKPTVPPRSATPTSRATLPSAKPTVPPRSSTPTTRSTIRSSTPTTTQSLPAPKSTSRASTPTRRTSVSSAPFKSPTSSSVIKSVTSTAKNPVPTVSNSPTTKPKPWKPSDMPGFSLDAPSNLRTSLSDRPASVTRGRTGAPSSRSSSIEPLSNGRVRRQSCSPARGRPPNGITRSNGSSVPVPAVNRLHAKANDNVSPVLYGTKMVERVINMRKLAPPKQDDKHSPMSNLSGKSSSPDSSDFGRTLSKKSLDMAVRHMGIRRNIPGNLRPLMTNIPASSMYSVRSGHNKSKTISMSDSAFATSSASSEVSVNNNALCMDGSEGDDDVSSDKPPRSPASICSRRR
ncbi:mucin-5AC-like isoform X2 [Olea europaea var. sylvestris]|uniref:mucin-5AC-like isoform X2 n=1 Tax=Olea europaea var. sylvestris TaxID=158386 RepID=UPI000C1CF70E|nr:mucin-5AC-like isoform X2 [Olea europaea var. sylvestris]